MVEISAQELCRVRTCIAADCGNDPEPSGYCTRCERLRRSGREVRLHRVEQPRAPNPAIELWCPGCMNWLPDKAFAKHNDANGSPARRKRRGECRECGSKRRARQRAAMTPEALAALCERDRARKHRRAQKDTTRDDVNATHSGTPMEME